MARRVAATAGFCTCKTEIPAIMAKGGVAGMKTFDQALFDLFQQGLISREEALRQCDSRRDMEWRMNFGGDLILPGTRAEQETPQDTPLADLPSL